MKISVGERLLKLGMLALVLNVTACGKSDSKSEAKANSPYENLQTASASYNSTGTQKISKVAADGTYYQVDSTDEGGIEGNAEFVDAYAGTEYEVCSSPETWSGGEDGKAWGYENGKSCKVSQNTGF